MKVFVKKGEMKYSNEGMHRQFDLNNIVVMSQRGNSDPEYLSRSPPKTDRPNFSREETFEPIRTERQLHQESPTRHDVEYYVRKVNRYEHEIAKLEHDLSVAKFRLSKTEDVEIKYDILFRENQKTVADCIDTKELLENTRKQLDRLKVDHTQAHQNIKNLKAEVDAERRNCEDVRKGRDELRTKSTSQGQQERQALKESFNKEIQTLKQQNRDIADRAKKEINELKGVITMKEVVESALANKLEHIKKQKNSEINRLKELTTALRDEIGQNHCQNEDNARKARNDVISETEDRIGNVRKLAQLIEETMLEEINNLNATLVKKNDQINFLNACDKRQLEDHENSENNLKRHIAKLEDKIFSIQRQNELELYNTIQRLTNQYNDNLAKYREEMDELKVTHNSQMDGLRRENEERKRQIELVNNENSLLEAKHKESMLEHQHSVQMLSQRNLEKDAERQKDLQNYTTSMRQIEDDAKIKMDDLHSAIFSKNTENEILNSQIKLKNGQISHLLEEIDRLREINRQKLKKLELTSANEQDALNNQISDLKKQCFQLRSKIHELETKITDDEASHQLDSELLKAELQSQKEANELLKSRNKFLNEWCEELDRDLKAERVQNVNILHDHNIAHRETVQIKHEVRVELEALKEKEIEQLSNIHRLEKNRLESDLVKKEHELRDKKEELGRLLVQYKALQAKMGKSSKVDRSAEDEGKCRATLDSQILLTENIFRAINQQ